MEKDPYQEDRQLLDYTMEIPNKIIDIYKGGLEVDRKGVSIRGKGRIFVKWLPMPETWFELQFCDECGLKYPETLTPGNADQVLLETGPNQQDNYMEIKGIPEHTISADKHLFPAKGKFRQMINSIREPNILAGNVTFPTPSANCDFIKFYILNFIKYFDRRLLVENDWTLEIDAIEVPGRSDNSDPINQVEDAGGFIITHTGILKRTDKLKFALADGINCLQAIYFLTSFMRGAWCGPTIARGINDGNKIIWQDGVDPRLTPWAFTHVCLDPSSIEGIEVLFQNFMKKWREEEDAIRSLVQWYVEANLNAGGTEGSIILVHAALELLANLNEFKAPAYCRIRRLIKNLGISPDLTEKQANLMRIFDGDTYELRTKDKKGQWHLDRWDGPSTFSELRNAIVHAKVKEEKPPLNAFPKIAREEALELGLWYLELCILKRLDYTGQYLNRIDLKREKVPWV
jgi:hypothetical protein